MKAKLYGPAGNFQLIINTYVKGCDFMNSESWVIAGVIATAASALASFIMAYLTKCYVKVSANMVKEMAETRQATFRPYVIVSLEYEDDSDIYLVIQNTGHTSAKHVRLHFDEALKDMHGDIIEKLAFSEPIPTMSPKWKYCTFVNVSRNITVQNGYVLKQGVTVTYSSDAGTEYTDYYVLNFALFKSRRWVKTKHSDDPKISLVNIAESMQAIANHVSAESTHQTETKRETTIEDVL